MAPPLAPEFPPRAAPVLPSGGGRDRRRLFYARSPPASGLAPVVTRVIFPPSSDTACEAIHSSSNVLISPLGNRTRHFSPGEERRERSVRALIA